MVLYHKASINVFSSKINKLHYVKKLKHIFLIFKKVRPTIEFKNCHSLVVLDTRRRDLIEREKIQL